jgi:hypothetical protein
MEEKMSIHKKRIWSKEEDALLEYNVKKYGAKNWTRISQNIEGRTGKQCRARWMDQLNPSLNVRIHFKIKRRNIFQKKKRISL